MQTMAQTVEVAPDKQVSLTNPDARSMATSGRVNVKSGVRGYQAASLLVR